MAKISGTKEWAAVNYDCVDGCSHDCRYCYARYNAVDRFKKIKAEDWTNEVINWGKVKRTHKLYEGTVMFPTQHDISPRTLGACWETLDNILKAGNKVLIVSKPHSDCIKALCADLKSYKDSILYRFTIGALDNDILKYWEPNAPSFGERFDSLQYAFKEGYETSVSCEPMLDSGGVVQLFDVLAPYVTDGIWIGCMNNIESRVKIKTNEDKIRVGEIKRGQTPERIRAIYNELKDDPKIRWKESFKSVLGLKLAEVAGEDK